MSAVTVLLSLHGPELVTGSRLHARTSHVCVVPSTAFRNIDALSNVIVSDAGFPAFEASTTQHANPGV
jgi:hypothetical protein